MILLPESVGEMTSTQHSFIITPSSITSETKFSGVHFSSTDEETIDTSNTFEILSISESSFSSLDDLLITTSDALIPSTVSMTLSDINEILSVETLQYQTYSIIQTSNIFSRLSRSTISTVDIMPHTTVLPSTDDQLSLSSSYILSSSITSSVVFTSSGVPTVSSVSIADHPLPSPEQYHLVIARLVVPQDDYTMLLQEQSHKKVELEEAITLEFMKAVLQLARKNHLAQTTVSKVET